MPGIVRAGDGHTGVCNHGEKCCPHIVSGVYPDNGSTVKVEGQSVVKVGDAVTTTCPHCGTGTVVGGSGTVLAEGKGVHRDGDAIEYGGGTGYPTSCSGTVIAG